MMLSAIMLKISLMMYNNTLTLHLVDGSEQRIKLTLKVGYKSLQSTASRQVPWSILRSSDANTLVSGEFVIYWASTEQPMKTDEANHVALWLPH